MSESNTVVLSYGSSFSYSLAGDIELGLLMPSGEGTLAYSKIGHGVLDVGISLPGVSVSATRPFLFRSSGVWALHEGLV